MKIEHLHEFVVLCESMNFTKAAKQLYITQPALSAHINALEKELNVTLLTRDHHHVRMTEYGRIFLEEAQSVIRQYDHLIARIQNKKGNKAEELRIGYLNYHFKDTVPALIEAYTLVEPSASLTLYASEYRDIDAALRHGDIDIAFTVNCDPTLADEFEFITLRSDPLMLAVPDSDPLASRESILPEELADIPILFPSARAVPKYAETIKMLFARTGITPNIDGYFNDVNSRTTQIEYGKRKSLIMRRMSPAMPNGIAIIPIASSTWALDMILVWKRTNLNSSIRPFATVVEEYYQEHRLTEL